MAIKQIFKVNRKTFFDPRSWLGYDALKQHTMTIFNVIKGIGIADKATQQETFDQAIARFNLTDKELQDMAMGYCFYAWFFVFLAVVSIAIGTYLLIHHGTFTGFLLSLAVTALFLGQAFRYHFWYFQIKQRKLGCTFEEWRRGLHL